MSVNDPLPWIEPVLALIRDAVARGIPVIGHCLGGQLMAKALGQVVSANPVKEIGWGRVTPTASAEARLWLGDTPGFEAYHWHGETFALPAGASCILSSEHCSNQAFVLDDKHLAMQCHVEMTEQMIATWTSQWADEARPASASVQPPEEQLALISRHLPHMREMADRLYTRWISGLQLT